MTNRIKRLIKSFTLVELLISLGIIAVAATAILLLLNPGELLKESRDSTRLLDLSTLNSALETFQSINPDGFYGFASTTYVSLIDSSPSCSNLGLPPLLDGSVYHCASSMNSFRSIDGTGWLPVNLYQRTQIPSIDQLPVDPINNAAAGYYYSYASPGKVWTLELNSVLESTKHKSDMLNDGGDLDDKYELGSYASLSASNHIPSAQTGNPTPVLISLSPSSKAVSSEGFTLQLNGSNFDSSSSVNWNGSARTTTFINSGQLSAAVNTSDLAMSGTEAVSVLNADTGKVSNSLNFDVYIFEPAGWVTDSSGGSGQGQGNSIVEAGGMFYVLSGSGKTFQQYNPILKTWTNLTQMPSSVNNGAVLVRYDNNTLFATRGNGTQEFWLYNITTQLWTQKHDTPEGVGVGGALAYPGTGDFIYLLEGDGNNYFRRYSVSLNTWSSVSPIPSAATRGGALASLNTNQIYAFVGGSTDFYMYDISSDTWISMNPTPSVVGNGGSLTSDGIKIFAFRGDDSNDFWKYTPSLDSWAVSGPTTLPIGISDGNARGGLAYSQSLNAIYGTPGVGNSIMKNSSL